MDGLGDLARVLGAQLVELRAQGKPFAGVDRLLARLAKAGESASA